MLSVSFDIDGTLIDNRSLIQQAYEKAGVQMSTEQWKRTWGRSFIEWLVEYCEDNYEKVWKIHREKNIWYAEVLAMCNIDEISLAPLHVARSLIADHRKYDVHFVSSASNAAAVAVLERVGVLDLVPPQNISAALPSTQKVNRVVELNSSHIDDDITVINAIQHQNYRALHYTGQNSVTIMEWACTR